MFLFWLIKKLWLTRKNSKIRVLARIACLERNSSNNKKHSFGFPGDLEVANSFQDYTTRSSQGITLVAPCCALLRDYLSNTPHSAVWSFGCVNVNRLDAITLPLACALEVRCPRAQEVSQRCMRKIPHESKDEGKAYGLRVLCAETANFQKRRNDNMNETCVFEGVLDWGEEGELIQLHWV